MTRATSPSRVRGPLCVVPSLLIMARMSSAWSPAGCLPFFDLHDAPSYAPCTTSFFSSHMSLTPQGHMGLGITPVPSVTKNLNGCVTQATCPRACVLLRSGRLDLSQSAQVAEG